MAERVRVRQQRLHMSEKHIFYRPQSSKGKMQGGLLCRLKLHMYSHISRAIPYYELALHVAVHLKNIYDVFQGYCASLRIDFQPPR